MAKSIVVEGSTTKEAIEKGLKELNVSKDMVEIETLEKEKKRSFYSILAPRVVKIKMTVKEKIDNNEEKVHIEKRPSNKNMEEINEAIKRIENFLQGILKDDIKYEIKVKDFVIYVNIKGEEINHLIGYRGNTINAIQVLVSAVANKNVLTKIIVIVDVANYREKRKLTLEDLAEKVSKTVIKTKKSITLEPMTAFERKIIHTKLQNNDKVKTFSKGEEPHRRIVITLK